MLRLLLLFLVCLSLVQNGVIAPAVCTTAACICPAPVPIAAPICVCNIDTTPDPSSNTCIYLDGCRTLYNIVQSCLLTIFACVWVAVHRNIPGPQQKSLSIYYQWLKVVVLALLVPEWILAWAVRQCLVARKLVTRLEEARVTAKEDWEKRHEIRAMEGNGERSSNQGETTESVTELRNVEHEHEIPLTRRHPTQIDIGTAGAAGGDVSDTFTMAARLARINEPWTMTHAFFIIMGGFHFYDGKPLRPLSSEDVLALVQRGALIPPTSKELDDKSKGDALSKGVAIVQTLWFVMQCIARRIKHLPITILEVVTLAYTVITVAMYAAWWNKPLNISCAVRVPGKAAQTANAGTRPIWERILFYIIGWQDSVTLSQEQRVPIFWADDGYGNAALYADAIAFVVAMFFGAVHCVAWSYVFPSHMEQLMWRISAITIVAVPVALLLSFGLYFLILLLSETLANIVLVVSWFACAIAYVTARILLLVLSFITLRSLPFGAYKTVQWTTFIPHV